MSKHPILLLLLAGLLVAAPRANGADIGMGLMGSYQDTSDLGDAWGGGLRIKYDITEYIAMDFRGSFLYLDQSSMSEFPLGGNLLVQYPIGNVVLPYAGFGGYYTIFSGGDLELENSPSYGPVAGVEIRLSSGFAITGEAQWIFLQPDVSNLPGSSYVDLNSFGVNVGVLFLF